MQAGCDVDCDDCTHCADFEIHFHAHAHTHARFRLRAHIHIHIHIHCLEGLDLESLAPWMAVSVSGFES